MRRQLLQLPPKAAQLLAVLKQQLLRPGKRLLCLVLHQTPGLC